MNVKQMVCLLESLTLIGSGALIAWWAIADGIPEFLFFTFALWAFGWIWIRRSRK